MRMGSNGRGHARLFLGSHFLLPKKLSKRRCLKMRMNQTIPVRVPGKLREAIDREAARRCIHTSALIRMILANEFMSNGQNGGHTKDAEQS